MSAHRYSDEHRFGRLTLDDAKKVLRPLGISVTSRSTGSFRNEYRVSYSRDAWVNWSAPRAEAMAAYTDDLEDAIKTGQSMAKEADKVHPFVGKPGGYE